MHWTGTQWSPTGILVNLTIGTINAGDTVDLSFIRTALIRSGVGADGRVIDIKCQWHPLAPADFPVIIAAAYEDYDTGEFRLTLYNSLAVNTDFGDRDLYIELTKPYPPVVAS